LDIDEKSPIEEVEKAYQKKRKALEPKINESENAKKEFEKATYAYKVLSDLQNKEKYDENKIEPTVLGQIISPQIFHIRITRFSPSTLDEFIKIANSVDNEKNLNTLILDLRGNVGGSIDILPYFLGPFIGQNQYAYELFSQGEHISVKTKTGWLNSLVRYKKVVILVDNQTQSTAELMAAVLKKYNVGVLLGTSTRGWGTIEKVFEIKQQISSEEKYSVFLVHTLTLRDDNEPIEGRGVDPVIYINDADWKNQLLAYFDSSELVKAVEKIWQAD
jgi:C-terminal processing protease CtpA/Prc